MARVVAAGLAHHVTQRGHTRQDVFLSDSFRGASLLLHDASAVRVLAVEHAVDGECVGGFVEEHAVIADAEPEESFKVADERLDSAYTRFGVAVDSLQNVQGGLLLDGTDFFRDVRPKTDSLHAAC